MPSDPTTRATSGPDRAGAAPTATQPPAHAHAPHDHPEHLRTAPVPWRVRLAELARFGAVGALAFVVDLGLFNLLRFGPGELLIHKPLSAKIISVLAATAVSWVGNRWWTFAEHKTERHGRELLAFVAINVVGMLVPVLTLAFSHYVLHRTSPLADNVATVVGIGLATIVRYLGYKRFVFTGSR
ncbi:GtrA family protein [Cellulomonas marina]|uniref:Putative flippase GtrA (Transmembrane translocase of bactoprenol-linked glucose) n=1 Tax=Cellulomonas marina TaxID=988821 RepID=A0A1I0X1M9_9CELL|nr:GtrA family protein [Cellulomonas marina]GIG29325.1 hypothetical protein Cma02nite_19250 [Cellulomonas marina]SFA94013.1 Putative flippase GtrA (transmembrane translocase of bactoprenol-linked glucose) [Cellulomonas marina]